MHRLEARRPDTEARDSLTAQRAEKSRAKVRAAEGDAADVDERRALDRRQRRAVEFVLLMQRLQPCAELGIAIFDDNCPPAVRLHANHAVGSDADHPGATGRVKRQAVREYAWTEFCEHLAVRQVSVLVDTEAGETPCEGLVDI